MSKFLFSIIFVLAIAVQIFAESNTTTTVGLPTTVDPDDDDGQVDKPGVNTNMTGFMDGNSTTSSTVAAPVDKSVAEKLGEKVEKSFVVIKHAIASIGHFITNLFSDETPKAELAADTPKSESIVKHTNTPVGIKTSNTTSAPKTEVVTTPASTTPSDSKTVKA